MTPPNRRAALALALLVAPACHVVRDDAPALLAQGRYDDALDALREQEKEAKSFDRPERARYALNRGLAHLAVGDAASAGRWLTEAKGCYDADPRCLSEADAGRLENAWRGMGRGFLRGACFRPAAHGPRAFGGAGVLS